MITIPARIASKPKTSEGIALILPIGSHQKILIEDIRLIELVGRKILVQKGLGKHDLVEEVPGIPVGQAANSLRVKGRHWVEQTFQRKRICFGLRFQDLSDTPAAGIVIEIAHYNDPGVRIHGLEGIHDLFVQQGCLLPLVTAGGNAAAAGRPVVHDQVDLLAFKKSAHYQLVSGVDPLFRLMPVEKGQFVAG